MSAPPAEPQFLRAERDRIVGVRATSHGVAASWVAPVALVDAPVGFGDETWIAASPDSVIAWQLAGADVHCEWGRFRGRTMAVRERRMTVMPAGQPNHYIARGRLKFGQFFFPSGLVAQVAASLGRADFTEASLRGDLVMLADPVLRSHLETYLERAKPIDPPTRLEMEARAILIVERLLTQHHAPRRESRPGSLAPWQLKRAKDLVEASLDRDLRLAEIAGAAKLSPFHFARAFKASTGEAPHRYLTRLRIERAKELLATTDLAISEIAGAVGLSDQGYLARLFRREVGTSPRRFRDERRA